MIRVRFKVEFFANWVPLIKVEVAGINVSVLLGERAEKWYVIQQSEQSLGNLYARPFHTSIGSGGVSDFINPRIFQNVQEGRARRQTVLSVL